MNPSSHRILLLQIWDHCNFKCPDCHWFSSRVTPRNPRKLQDYLAFLERFPWIDRVVLSGGEPTLWDEAPSLVDQIGTNVGQVALYTNGSRPHVLRRIERRNVYVRLSIHRQTSFTDVAAIHELCEERGWKIKMYAYYGNTPEFITDFEKFGEIKINNNQLKLQTGPLPKKVYCEPRMIYMGTDGHAYYCERGLRTKERSFRMGFSLTEGDIRFGAKECTPNQGCLTCASTEQYFHEHQGELTSAWRGSVTIENEDPDCM